jgi:hypothetical protein
MDMDMDMDMDIILRLRKRVGLKEFLRNKFITWKQQNV